MKKPGNSVTILLILSLLFLAACGSASENGGPTLTLLEADGKRAFSLHCATCPATSGDTVIVGPSLDSIATQAATRVPVQDTREYIEFSILKLDDFIVEDFPNTMPPDFGKILSGEDFDALIAYLMSLK